MNPNIFFMKNDKNILQSAIKNIIMLSMKSPLPSSRREKVQRLSRVFRLMCRVLLAFGSCVIVGLTIPYLLARRGPMPDFYSMGATVIGMAGLCYWLLGAWLLERLFSNFIAGRHLESSSGLWLKRFGFWMATCCLFPFAGRYLWDVAFYGAPGAIRETPMAPIFGSILAGLFLLMLGWVLEEAGELQAEQELTI
ncbi:MAG: DUF2975 domain-containing protein [Armatimonadota bacterium]|nr:DUF2975 domain-containing protein [Armatimonadota bacterium]